MSKIKLDAFGYSLNPVNLSEDLWFYEGRKGLEIYVRTPAGGSARKISIPWRRLDPSLKRRAKYLRRRAALKSGASS